MPSVKRILLISNTKQIKSSLGANTIISKKFLKPFLSGIIVGLCFSLLIIFSFPEILNNQYNDILSIDKYNFHVTENRTLADKLYKEVRVLCWIMTSTDNHEKKAQHIKNTWGPRCNKLLFMSSTEDSKLGTVVVPVAEGQEELWGKTKGAFKYIYKHHFEEYDWFLKADDDTYVVVENLRKMLYAYNSEFPIYLGSRRREVGELGFMYGEAGYVLSKEALKRFINIGLPNATICRKDNGGLVDIELAKCMENIQVLAGDSRDNLKHGRMFPHQLIVQFLYKLDDPRMKDINWNLFYFKSEPGPNSTSDNAISFHNADPIEMYILHYLIYGLKPFGIPYALDVLPQKKSLDELISEHSLSSVNANYSLLLYFCFISQDFNFSVENVMPMKF